MGGIPPQSALCVMCITPLLMELQTVLSIAEWGVMHTVHDAFFAFKAFLGQDFTGQGCCPGLAVPVRFLAALCALDTGLSSPVSGSVISAPCHSFCK